MYFQKSKQGIGRITIIFYRLCELGLTTPVWVDKLHKLSARSNFMSGVAGQFHLDHQKAIDYLEAVMYDTGIPAVIMAVVTTTTIITTIKLR